MKLSYFFLLILLTISITVFGNQKEVSKEQAWHIVLNNVLNGDVQNKDVYISNTIVTSKSIVGVKNETSPDYDSWLIFIDDVPKANWSHSCRYAYVNIADSSYVVYERRMPPYFSQMSLLTKKREAAGNNGLFNIPTRSNNGFSANHNYAVILNGGIAKEMNYERYWNDCSAIYSTLVNIYNYPRDNIYVIMSDGTDPGLDLYTSSGYISSPLDLDGDGTNDIQYAATKDNVNLVFNKLKERMSSDDELFIFTMDHGDRDDSSSVICLWGDDSTAQYSENDLSNALSELNCAKINICMGQCFSGGFINALSASNRVITTACGPFEPSYPLNDNYDALVYYWVSAVTGSEPDGTPVNADTNHDGYVSMLEAFNYVSSHDHSGEYPNYNSNPQNLGTNLLLKSSDVIYGNSSVNLSENFSLYGNPYTTVSWECNGTGFSISPSNRQCTVTGTNSYHEATLYANIYKYGQLQKTLTKPILSQETSLYVEGTQYKHTSPSGTYPQQRFTINASNALNGYCPDSISVNADCDFLLVSDRFKGMDISFEGIDSLLPTEVYCLENIVAFRLQDLVSPYALTLKAQKEGGCYDFNLNFKVSPIPDPNSFYYGSLPDLVLNLSGNMLNVTLNSPLPCYSTGEHIPHPAWNLRIISAQTGAQVYSTTVLGMSTNVFVGNFASGLYIVSALYEGNTYYAKVYINQ